MKKSNRYAIYQLPLQQLFQLIHSNANTELTGLDFGQFTIIAKTVNGLGRTLEIIGSLLPSQQNRFQASGDRLYCPLYRKSVV